MAEDEPIFEAELVQKHGERPGVPRLRIWHLMLWMFCIAFFLTFFRSSSLHPDDLPSGYRAIPKVLSLVNGIASGAVLAGFCVLLMNWMRCGPPLFQHPGHWLMAATVGINIITSPIVVFVTLIALAPVIVVMSVLRVAAPFGSSCVAGAIIVISALDLAAGRRRDWLHWAGIAAFLALTSVVFIGAACDLMVPQS